MSIDSVRRILRVGLTIALAILAGKALASSTRKDLERAAKSDVILEHAYRFLLDDKAKAAVKYFDKAAKVDPENASAFEGMGDAWHALGQGGRADDAWSMADRLNNGWSFTKARRLAKEESDSDSYLKKCMVAARMSAKAYKVEIRGDFKFSAELFERALAAAPDYWHARTGLEEIREEHLDLDQTLPTRAATGDQDDQDDDKD